MSAHINGTERTGRTKVLTRSTTDTFFYIYYRNLWRICFFRIGSYHLYGNCARHCPAGAIQMVPSDPEDEASIKIPVVNAERCIGCGACENLCPSRPFSAIYVEGHVMHRTV